MYNICISQENRVAWVSNKLWYMSLWIKSRYIQFISRSFHTYWLLIPFHSSFPCLKIPQVKKKKKSLESLNVIQHDSWLCSLTIAAVSHSHDVRDRHNRCHKDRRRYRVGLKVVLSMHNMKNVIGGDDTKKRSSGPDLVSGRDSRSFHCVGPSLRAMHR